MKKYLLALFTGVLYLSAVRSQEIFSFDFSQELSDNFAVWDVDKNTPAPDMQKLGFKVGSPWVKIRESDASSNWFYGSTSSYQPAGQANDWLVTKGLFIQNGGCVLEWKSQAYNPQKRDGLKIFISTQGQRVEDFPEAPEWEIEEESAGISEDPDIIEGEGEWTSHSLALDKYVGETVYIAFVNQSEDKSIIFIDDIWVGKHLDYIFSDDSENYIVSPEGELKGTLKVTEDITINAYTAHYSYDGKEFSKEYTGLSLKQGDTHEFVFEEKISLDLYQSAEYKMWISREGENSLYTTGTVTRVSRIPRRRVVIEEGTGTWCQYCATGMWAMDHLYEISKETEDFIGIAVHNGDPMTDRLYNRALGFQSFPIGAVNRKFSCSPLGPSFDDPWGEGSFVANYQKERKEMAFFDIKVEGAYKDDSTAITAKAIVESVLSFEKTNYRIAFVLLENGITGYSQVNAYSGAPYEIGGFQKLPNPCYPVFNDVARGIWPEFAGAENSVSASLLPDTPVEYSYEITLPKSVENKKNLRLVALLLDASTREVLNAAVCPMTEVADLRVSSVASAKNDLEKIKTEVRNGCLFVYVNTNEKVTVEVFDVTGKKMDETKGEGETWFPVSANGFRGMVLLKIKSGRCVITRKIIL